MDPTRLLAPGTYNLGQQQPQHQQQQQHQQQPPPQQQQQQQSQGQIGIAPNGFPAQAGGLEGYDMSSLDQLQAHALQLSASAGLTNLLMPQQNQPNPQAPQQQQQQQQQTNKAQQPFLFFQPGNPAAGGHQGLQSLANFGTSPAGQGDNNNNNSSGQQAPNAGQVQATQSFIIPGPNGEPTTITAPASLSQQLFAAASAAGGPACLTMAPNGALQPQQQSYSSAGIPIPIPMLIPQSQQQQQQQLQPLQPAPSSSTSADNSNQIANSNNAALAGNKRVHDSSIVSSSTMSINSGGGGGGGTMSMNMEDYPEFQLRNKDGSIITEKDLEKMTPAERRRYERNLREQQRSFRISQQIQQLRDVLAESKVPFKPNKYSILVSVADYIKQLQTRAVMLDSEHKKLFKTIQETNEMVASGQIPDPNATVSSSAAAPNSSGVAGTSGSGAGGEAGNSGTSASDTKNGIIRNDQGELLFVQGLDYKAVFEQTPTANGVASIDGRILACNKELEKILDCPRDQIERQSLFTLVKNHQEIFEAMAELLKRADALSNGSLKADPIQLLYWSGRVVTPDEKKVI